MSGWHNLVFFFSFSFFFFYYCLLSRSISDHYLMSCGSVTCHNESAPAEDWIQYLCDWSQPLYPCANPSLLWLQTHKGSGRQSKTIEGYLMSEQSRITPAPVRPKTLRREVPCLSLSLVTIHCHGGLACDHDDIISFFQL